MRPLPRSASDNSIYIGKSRIKSHRNRSQNIPSEIPSEFFKTSVFQIPFIFLIFLPKRIIKFIHKNYVPLKSFILSRVSALYISLSLFFCFCTDSGLKISSLLSSNIGASSRFSSLTTSLTIECFVLINFQKSFHLKFFIKYLCFVLMIFNEIESLSAFFCAYLSTKHSHFPRV